jgi:DNA-binding GntR family transcriptional regulator
LDAKSRGSLTHRVTERLRRAILDGELELGEALSEDKLANALNVSRSPVRQAFTALEQQGLIDVQPQRGSFVFLPSEDDTQSLCAFRKTIETEAMQLSIQRRRAETLAALKAAAKAMDKAFATGDHLRSARADDEFHDALIAKSGNPYLINAYRLVSGKVAALRSHRSTLPTRQQANAEHHRIIAFLEAGDMAGALDELSTHILRMAERYSVEPAPTRQPGARGPRGATLAHIGPLAD